MFSGIVSAELTDFGHNMPSINIVHVVPGLHAKYGGPSYSVPRLCEALVDQGMEVTIFSVADPRARESHTDEKGFSDHRFAWDYGNLPILRGLRKSSGLARSLREAIPGADLVHIHGLWLHPNIQSGRIATRWRRPHLISPRGMLAPAALRFSSVRKKLVWAACQRTVMEKAACLHATSHQEYEDIRAMGLTNPIAIIPNGIDVPNLSENLKPHSRDRIALSLGRIHPKKGLDCLVRAWAQVEGKHPAWKLRIVGPDEVGHAKELNELAKALGVERLSIEAAVYGAGKSLSYRESDLFILPTRSENFGLTVAEALAAGTPAICTQGAPWRGLETERCGWWVEQGVEPIVAALDFAMTMTRETLGAMGARGRAWMLRDFSWEKVGQDMRSVYDWVLGNSEQPSMVHLN